MRLPNGLVLVLGLSLAGCLQRDPPPVDRPTLPSWVEHVPSGPGLLYAVGGGATRDAALANARQELARQVQLDIVAESTSVDRLTTTQSTGTARAESLASEACSQVRTRAALSELPGVSVQQQEQAGDTVYILLCLDRGRWAMELTGRLTAANERLAALDRDLSVTPATSPAERLALVGRLLAELLPTLAERDEAARRLHLADPTARPGLSIDRQQWLTRLGQLLDQLQVRLPTGSPELEALMPALTQALATVGLRATTDAQAPLTLDLSLSLTERPIGDQVRVDGSLVGSLGLTPLAGGRRLGGISLTDRAGSTLATQARERVLNKIATRLATDLATRLPGMLAGRID